MAHDRPLNQSFTLAEDGLPPEELLSTLSVQDWMLWLKSRGTPFDAFTGQHLRGDPDPYSIFRDSIIRLGPGPIAAHFVEGALQLVRDILTGLKGKQNAVDPNSSEDDLSLLSSLLDLLCSLSQEIVCQSLTLRSRADDLYYSFIRTLVQSMPGAAYSRAVRSTMLFISKFSFRLTRDDLIRLLNNLSTAGDALLILMESGPANRSETFAAFIKTCWDNGKPVLVSTQIKAFRRSLGDVGTIQLISSATSLLDSEIGDKVLSSPVARELFAQSLTLNKFKEHRAVYFKYKGYVPQNAIEREFTPLPFPRYPSYAKALAAKLHQKAKDAWEVHGVHIEYVPYEWQSGGEEAEDATEGVVALDPITLSRKRSKSIRVVPYGYIRNVALLYVKPAREVGLESIVTSWNELSSAVKSGYDIGYLLDTASAEELRQNIFQERLFLKLHGWAHLEILIEWIRHHWQDSILVVDDRFSQTLQTMYEKFVIGGMMHGYQLATHPIPYAKPLLAGVPFPVDDRVWGEITREAVDEVFYDQYRIHQESELARDLRSCGITPLTPSSFRTFEPLVDVEDAFYPLTVRGPRETTRTN